jgi:hypothetical protein
MSAVKELYFEPINFEEQKKNQPVALNYETTVKEIKNGVKVNTHEETGFILAQYSGFAPKEIKTGGKTITYKPNQRNYIKLPIIPEQKSCLELEQQLNMYDNALSENFEATFGSYSKLFTQIRSVKEPKEADDLDIPVNSDKPSHPKFKSCKLRLEMSWNYYIDDQVLDDKNAAIVRNAFFDAKKKKIDTASVVVKLNFTDEDGNQVKRDIKIGDIEQRKDKIITKVLYRRPDSIPTDAKKVEECTEKELIKYYGKGELVSVNTPDDLDKYHRNNCYIRYVYEPIKVYAQRSKGDDGMRKCSYIFQIKLIDIINTRQNITSTSSNKQYENYAFRQHDASNYDSNDETTEVNQTTVSENDETRTSKQNVIQTDADDSQDDVDGEEQEEEDDDEPVVETKPKSRSKVVVEESKSKVSTRKTK